MFKKVLLKNKTYFTLLLCMVLVMLGISTWYRQALFGHTPAPQPTISLLPADPNVAIDPKSTLDYHNLYYGTYQGRPSFLLETTGDYGYQIVTSSAATYTTDATLRDLENPRVLLRMDIPAMARDIFAVSFDKEKKVVYVGITFNELHNVPADMVQTNVIFRIDLQRYAVEEVISSKDHPELLLYLGIDEVIADRYLVIDGGQCGPCDLNDLHHTFIVDRTTHQLKDIGGVTDVQVDVAANTISFRELLETVDIARSCSVLPNGETDESDCEEWERPGFKPDDTVQTVPLF